MVAERCVAWRGTLGILPKFPGAETPPSNRAARDKDGASEWVSASGVTGVRLKDAAASSRGETEVRRKEKKKKLSIEKGQRGTKKARVESFLPHHAASLHQVVNYAGPCSLELSTFEFRRGIPKVGRGIRHITSRLDAAPRLRWSSCELARDTDIRHPLARTREQANSLASVSSFMNNVNSIRASILSRSIRKSLQSKRFATKQPFKMPLVVPGINSGGDASKTEEWQNKLVGKKIGEGASDATVFLLVSSQIARLMLSEILDIRKGRSPKGNQSHSTRTDGYQGFQSGQVSDRSQF